jgi:transcription elongation factor SPT5
MVENSGIFVARAANCTILGGAKKMGPGGLPTASPRVGAPYGANLRSPARSAGPNRPYTRDAPVNRRLRNDPLLNQTVTIKSGQWKGYVGIVKDCTDTTARVELHSAPKTVTINREYLSVSGTNQQSYQPEFAPRTPMHSWDSTRTPMREDIMGTPSRDVMATPLRAPGTPLRVGGMSTPIHGTAWDPTQPNTPLRPSWDYNKDNEYGSSSWTPDYTVTTPGSSFQPSGGYSPFSPAQPRHSFRDDSSEMNPTTPGSTFTPGYDVTPGSTFTPHSGYSQRTPQDITTPYGSTPYQPTTPATPLTPHTPHTPGTPGGDIYHDHTEERSEASASWHTTDIEVNITAGSHRSSKGVIREVLADSCRVVLESGETAVIANQDLESVVPSHKGNIKIIQGELRGQTGVLIGIDGADGIVKMSSNLDIKILDLHHLALYQPA